MKLAIFMALYLMSVAGTCVALDCGHTGSMAIGITAMIALGIASGCALEAM